MLNTKKVNKITLMEHFNLHNSFVATNLNEQEQHNFYYFGK